MYDDCYSPKLSEEEIEEQMPRVLNTVEWLDGIKPEWRGLVDWSNLAIDSIIRCVAGYVFAEEARKAGVGGGYAYLIDEYEDGNDFAFVGNEDVTSNQMTQVWHRWRENNPD